MRFLPALFLILLSSLSWSKEGPTEKIYFGVNANHTLPLVEIYPPPHSPEVESGLLKDLGEAIASELKLKPTWILLPKNRIAPSIVSGDIDVICHIHKIWQNGIRDDVFWSDDLYTSENVIIHTNPKSIQKIKDLQGERVGTVLNFIYQDLEPAFVSKQIIREDAPTNQSNIQKLIHGRLDYVVMSSIEYDYYSHIYPILRESDLKMDSIRTKCALSKKSKISLSQLNRAIDSIKKNGIYLKILKNYTDVL